MERERSSGSSRSRRTKSAAVLARQALEEAQRPERERRAATEKERAAQEKRDKAKTLRSARERFNRSEIPNWFPDTEWQFVERWRSLDIWQSGEDGDYDRLRLAVRQGDKAVLFVTYKDWGERTNAFRPPEQVWDGQLVNSAAEVGKALENYREAGRWPERENWAD